MRSLQARYILFLCLPCIVASALAGNETVLATTIERGEDFAIYSSTVQSLDPDGKTSTRTNRFTLMENALNYQDDSGQWVQSDDLIESFPDGAIARRGPNKAVFSPELNTADVFDVQCSNGKRITGGIRAIQITDTATGATAVLARVKASAIGKLLPPNTLLYEDCMEGLGASVVLTWRHNLFAQDVVLNERPILPEGFDPATTTLEVVTEFTQIPAPEVVSVAAENNGGQKDDLTFILVI